MERGKISMYHKAKGYGFILPHLGGPAVFVHRSTLEPREPAPEPGDEIDFEAVAHVRGYRTTRATLVRARCID